MAATTAGSPTLFPGVVIGVGEGSSNQIVNGIPVPTAMWNIIFDGLYSRRFFTLETECGVARARAETRR